MRIEILVLAALAVLANAAPQWPYRDAVAPYYYGYPGKTPYMYRSGDEDDEMEAETSLSRQDLKVAPSKDAAAGSSVTVVEDDEKADGIRVVETGSAKPVAQSGNSNNRQTQQQEQAAPAASTQPQAQQPLANNNPNNAQPANNGQPLTVQAGQQPPAFPPARPAARPRPVEEEEDEDEEEDDSEEDEEDADNEEDADEEDDDNDEEDEEEEDDRRRNDKVPQPSSGSGSESEEPQQIVQEQQQPQSSIVNSNSGSDELVQEEEQPVVVQPQSQSAVLNNKVSKNKQKINAAPAVVPNVGGNRKKVNAVPVAIGSNKNNKNPGAIEALVPGYVTDQGEVLVPVDTVTGSQPITIVPDPFSPPSRIVSGPRPIPQSAVPNTPRRQVPYWYRSSPAVNPNPFVQEAPRQTLYSSAPPPGSIFTFDDDDDDDEDTPSVIPGTRLRQEDEDEGQDDGESEEDEVKAQPKPPKVPLAAVPAIGSSGEDDEAEALAFVNSGGIRPGGIKRPAAAYAAGGNKKPAGTKDPSSNESESEEDIESEEQEEEEDVSQEEEEEDDAARRVVLPGNKGRMYVDEDYVSFPPSRSPSLFAVFQGSFPGQGQRRQPQIISSPSPYNANQRYVVRVTPANRPRPPTQQPLYYRPQQSSPPNRRVVPVASFDVSVEDTGPQSGPSGYFPGVDSDEEGESVISSSGPTPVSSYPFVYKVQGSLQGLRYPGQGPPRQRPSGLRPPRPSASIAYFGGPGGPGGPSRPQRPSYGPSPYSSPYAQLAAALYGPYGPNGPASFAGLGPNGFSFSEPSEGPRRPPSGGPPVIVRRKQPGGGRPPKPQLIAVYNPTGSSSGPRPNRPRPREPVEEEYYTFEVPETNHKLVSGRPPSNNKRPTVHRKKPTPVIHQKLVSEDEEESDEVGPGGPPSPQHQIQIIPQGTVRRRSKQLKPKKKSSKKNSSSNKKQPQQDQQDPLGLLSKINKSTKSKFH